MRSPLRRPVFPIYDVPGFSFQWTGFRNADPYPTYGNAHVSEIAEYTEPPQSPELTLDALERAYNEAVRGMQRQIEADFSRNGQQTRQRTFDRLTGEWHAPKKPKPSERVEFGTERKIKLP